MWAQTPDEVAWVLWITTLLGSWDGRVMWFSQAIPRIGPVPTDVDGP